ncbi:MAG: MFS transporter [Gemmatimonadota bacterium]
MASRRPVRPVYAWYVVGVLTLALVSSFVDRQILSLMVGPIKRDLGVSDSKMSLLGGASFALFYTFLGLPIGRLADQKSRRGIIGVGVAVWSLMTALCGMARSYTELFLARIGVGVGEASLSPPAYSLIADYFPKERLGTAIGVYSLGIYLGSGLALALGGWIVGKVSGTELWTLPIVGATRPWQVVFFVIGLPGLLIALLLRTVKEPERTGGQRPAVPLRAVAGYMRSHARAFLSHNLGFGFIALVNYGSAFWVPTFLVRHFGWTITRAGYVYGLSTMTLGVLGVVAGGWLGDRLLRAGYLDAKLRIGIIAALGVGACAILMFTAESEAILFAGLLPSTFFSSFGFGAAAAGIQEITPPAVRAQASSVYLFVVNLVGLGLGPSAVSTLTDYWFKNEAAVGQSLLIVAVASLVLSILCFTTGLDSFRRAAREVGHWSAPA